MAIDTSAFDKYKKNSDPNAEASSVPTNIDISAFGYQWNTPTTTTPQNEIWAANQRGKEDLQNSLERLSQRDMSQDVISAPETDAFGRPTYQQGRSPFINFAENMRRILPEGLSEPLFGTGITYDGKPDGGFFGWWYENLVKSDIEKVDDRVEKLTQARNIDGKYFAGVPEERAKEIAWKEVMGEEMDDLTPLEEKILKHQGRWELAGKGLDLMDAAPVIGRVVSTPFRKALTRIAKSSDALFIGKEIDKILPKLPADQKATAVRLLTKADNITDVERIVGEAVQDAARVAARAPSPQVARQAAGTLDDAAQAGIRATQPSALSRLADRASNFVAGIRRNAPDIRVTRARIAPIIDEVEEPARFREAVNTFQIDDIPERIRALSRLSDDAEDAFRRFQESVALEKKVFEFENPSVRLDTPEGEQVFQQYFRDKFGVEESAVNNIKYFNSIYREADDIAQAGIGANRANNQTPITVGGKTVVTQTDVDPIAKLNNQDVNLGDIKDIARRDQTAFRPTRATGAYIQSGRDLAKEMEGNLAKYNQKINDKKIVKLREQLLLGPETILDIIVRKRGIITDAMSIERAKVMRGTIEDVMNLPKGTTATVEQYRAIEQVVQQEWIINQRLRTLIDNGGVGSSAAERGLVQRLGADYKGMTDMQILNEALAESTRNVVKGEIVLQGIRSETGRTLQAFRKVVEGVDNRLRILMNRINANNKWDDLEKQAMMERVLMLNLDDSQQFIKALQEIEKADNFAKFAEYSVAAKLWNPTTHLVNLGGNTLRMMADIGIKTATDPMVARADAAGAWTGLKQGLKNAVRALTDEGYAQQLSKYIETGGTAPAIGGKLGYWVRTPFRALGASDEIFKNMAYQRKLYRDAYRTARKEGVRGDQLARRMEEILNQPTFKMMEDATAEAKRMTFQEDLGPIMSWINKGRNPENFPDGTSKAFAVFLRLFLPFLKTPANLFKQSIDLSPIGLIKNQRALRQAIKNKDREKVGTIVGEAILGSAIAVWIMNETLEGNITGGAPRDAKQRDKFYRELKQPYSIKIGDYWYEYKRIDPFATVIGLTGDLVTLLNDPNKPADEKDVGALIGIVTENLKDKTYLSGISDLMKVVAPSYEWERDYAWKSAVLGAVLPSIVGHTARSVDPTIRRADSLADRLLVQIPGLSQNYPARVNVLGYDAERANKGFGYFFVPVQRSSAEIDPVTQEFMKYNYTLPIPADYFTVDGNDYKLDNDQYEDYARYVGLALRYELPNLFDSPSYQRANKEEKIKLIEKLRTEKMKEYKEAFHEEQQAGQRPTGRSIEDARRLFQDADAGTGTTAPAPQPGDNVEEIRRLFQQG